MKDRNQLAGRAQMFTPELLLHVDPAPVTVTVPCPLAPLPTLAVKLVILMTFPPFAIVSVPVPKLPILSLPLSPEVESVAFAKALAEVFSNIS
jgi:hypothetical protein